MAIGQVPGQQKDAEDGEESLFSEINITPLTDIFLVLLIIFMVTSSVIVEMADPSGASSIKVETSSGASSLSAGGSGVMMISLAQGGQLSMNGSPISYESLSNTLIQTKTAMPQTRVVIHPDGATPYRFVLAVISAVKQAKVPFAIAGK